MTNAKISKKAQAVLRNKRLSSAIAKAVAGNSHSLARQGVVITVNGEPYTIKLASANQSKEFVKEIK